MTDRELTAQPAQLLLVEDLRDEAHVAQRRQPAAVGNGDSGGLLPAMLQREETEVRDAGDVTPRRPNSEQTAHLKNDSDLLDSFRSEPRDVGRSTGKQDSAAGRRVGQLDVGLAS